MLKNKSDLLAQIESLLPNNTSGQISPADHRTVSIDDVDSNLNLVEPSEQTVAGPVDFIGGVKVDGIEISGKYEFVTVLQASSQATSQLPSGVDTPLQVEFGPAQGDSSSEIQLLSSGRIIFNRPGIGYRIVFGANIGRTGAAGISFIFGRSLVNGVQGGESLFAQTSSSDAVIPVEASVNFKPNAIGDYIDVEIIRDSAGNNSGGLYRFVPTLAGWNASSSASITITKIEAV